MTEGLLLIGAGFLSASLLAIVVVQFAWRRAVKVTERRLGLPDIQNGTERPSYLQIEAELREQTQQNAALTEQHVQREAELQEQAQQYATLSEQHEQHEQALAENTQQQRSLNADLSNLHAHYEAAQNDVDAAHRRIAELEEAISNEIARQAEIETKLRTFGESAARLANDIAVASPLSTAAPLREQPAPVNKLETIKSADGNYCEPIVPLQATEHEEPDDLTDETPHSERPLDERIRALEAGVAS